MITLYSFGPAFGLPDPSPFVMKAQVLLAMAGLPYQSRPGNPRRAPKGKLPYLDDDGTTIADSTFIRWHLEQRYGVDFDAGLTPAQRGLAWAVEKMLEDHLYWAMLDLRWRDPANFSRGPVQFFERVPLPLRLPIRWMVRRKVAQDLLAHGLGRHTRAEIERLAGQDIEALAAILGDQPYLMGAQPCGADATVHAFIAGLLCPVFETPLRTRLQGHANLVAYVERLNGRYWREAGTAPAAADARMQPA